MTVASIPEEEARKIMADGLGKAELEFVMSLTAPLYWIVREAGKTVVRNGSTFFLDAGHGVFGITAAHVVEGWGRDYQTGNVTALQLGSDLPIDFTGKHANLLRRINHRRRCQQRQ